MRIRPYCLTAGIEAAKRLQIAEQIVEVAVAEPIGTEHRHRRLAAVLHRLHLVLLVALDALARVHDLDREQVLVLLHALDRRAVRRRDGHRLEAGAKIFGAAANARQQHVAGAGRSDARQIRTEPAAGAVDLVTGDAHRAKHLRAVLGVAARRLGRRRRGQRLQVGEHLPHVAIGGARRDERRHFRVGHAAANRVEEALVGAAGVPDLGDVGTAHAAAVGAVAVGAAHAEAAHAGQDGLRIAFEGILGLGRSGPTARPTRSARRRQRPRTTAMSWRPFYWPSGGSKGLRRLRLFFLGLVDVRRLAEEHFGRFHQRFGERRVRMDRQLEIRRGRAHLDRDHAFGDQLARA